MASAKLRPSTGPRLGVDRLDLEHVEDLETFLKRLVHGMASSRHLEWFNSAAVQRVVKSKDDQTEITGGP